MNLYSSSLSNVQGVYPGKMVLNDGTREEKGDQKDKKDKKDQKKGKTVKCDWEKWIKPLVNDLLVLWKDGIKVKFYGKAEPSILRAGSLYEMRFLLFIFSCLFQH